MWPNIFCGCFPACMTETKQDMFEFYNGFLLTAPCRLLNHSAAQLAPQDTMGRAGEVRRYNEIWIEKTREQN